MKNQNTITPEETKLNQTYDALVEVLYNTEMGTKEYKTLMKKHDALCRQRFDYATQRRSKAKQLLTNT